MSDNYQRAQNISHYKRLFLGSDLGKAVLEDLAAEGMLDTTTFDINPQLAAYNQGKRDFVLEIYAKLNVDIKQFLTSNIPTEDF